MDSRHAEATRELRHELLPHHRNVAFEGGGERRRSATFRRYLRLAPKSQRCATTSRGYVRELEAESK